MGAKGMGVCKRQWIPWPASLVVWAGVLGRHISVVCCAWPRPLESSVGFTVFLSALGLDARCPVWEEQSPCTRCLSFIFLRPFAMAQVTGYPLQAACIEQDATAELVPATAAQSSRCKFSCAPNAKEGMRHCPLHGMCTVIVPCTT